MSDRVGQQVEKYRLLRLLGEGGYGYVYLAENVLRGTQVAVKLLKFQLTVEEFPTFLNEARAILLKHPHIVPMLDFGIEHKTSTPFLVMDYAPNGTLRQRHPAGSRLQLATVVQYVQAIAYALQYAHEEDLIHRDVKPENMLVGQSQEVMLSDFGISIASYSGRISKEKSQEFIIRGTYHYMAPEQLQGKAVRASDQYALGVVAYEWLCGAYPFQGNFYQVSTQHMQMPPPSLRAQGIPISAPVEAVLMRALAKDARKRFESVWEFALALREASRGGSPLEEKPWDEAQRDEVRKKDVAPPFPIPHSPVNALPAPGVWHGEPAVPGHATTPAPSIKQPGNNPAIRNQPHHERLLDEGNKLYQAQRYEEAIRIYGQLIFQEPRNIDAYYQRGSAYYQIKLFQLAISDFEQVIALHPRHANAYYAKGLAYYNLEWYQRALNDFDWAIELHPGDAEIYRRRGSTNYRLERYQQAISDFDVALTLQPQHGETYLKRGRAYLKLKQYPKAISDFDRALALDSGNAGAYHFRGIAYEQIGQYQRASYDFDQERILGQSFEPDL
ncbi:MAG TPA: serine/threonine-protein kinase [Ktedonosporobacter sp.]|nr:serine/threonine-protein kinase [Ktedonosporobacter sp.]